MAVAMDVLHHATTVVAVCVAAFPLVVKTDGGVCEVFVMNMSVEVQPHSMCG